MTTDTRPWDEWSIPNTKADGAHPVNVLACLLLCAEHWVPDARIVGNVRAGDIARAIRSFSPGALAAMLDEPGPKRAQVFDARVEAALAVEGTEAKPVAWRWRYKNTEWVYLEERPTWFEDEAGNERFEVEPLYTTPPAEGTPKVKALEWEKDWRGDLDDIPAWRAETPVGRLSFSVHGYSSHDAAPIERTEAAKAEIQSAYEKRVLSCLEYTTPPAGIREAGGPELEKLVAEFEDTMRHKPEGAIHVDAAELRALIAALRGQS
ncbi:MAG: hypothetical protein KDJ36_07055 [Hyphomicrobiaceae bacterium]|nr:hypothetical protein [Hyphomicrobiaceae bacterium]